MDKKNTSRFNRVGGQAVLEGVMMKAGNRTVTTCRKPDGSLTVNDAEFDTVRKKHKILNVPIVRGVVNFVEMILLSVKTLGASADALGLEEEETKLEKWLKEKLGVKSTDVIMLISTVLGLALSVLLFVWLPIGITAGINWLLGFAGLEMHPVITSVVEGLVKVAIFLAYLSLVSLMPEIRRTFMYHGAEHKSIACFEAGDDLTPENAAKHKRFHPRCGTSLMFFMILIGIVAGMFIKLLIPGLSTPLYMLIRLAILPLLVGIGYEVIMLAGKHDNWLTRAISAPGLWVQRITTKEPTEDMLECAIVSIKCALRDDFDEFREFYETRAWEKREEHDPLLENDTCEFSEIAAGIGEDDESQSSDFEESAETTAESQNSDLEEGVTKADEPQRTDVEQAHEITDIAVSKQGEE